MTNMNENIILTLNNPIIKGHKVQDSYLLPGMAYIDIIYNTLRSEGIRYNSVTLCDFFIFNPLIIESQYTTILHLEGDVKSEKFTINGSRLLKHDGKIISKEDCFIVTANINQNTIVEKDLHKEFSFNFQKSNIHNIIPLDSLYDQCRALGLVHSGYMKAVGETYETETEVLVEVMANSDIESKEIGIMFHPAVFDISAIAGGWWFLKDNINLYIPISFSSFNIVSLIESGKKYFGRINKKSISLNNEMLYFDMDILNEKGRIIAHFEKLGNKLVHHKYIFNHADRKNNISWDINTIQGVLQNIFAQELNIASSQVSCETGYYEMGVSSSSLLKIHKKINALFSCNLSPTILFEYTTINALADYLGKEGVNKNIQYDILITDNQTKIDNNDDIAIIGMSGRYPQANSLNEFWDNLKHEKDCITEIPISRWDWHSLNSIKNSFGKKISHWGGFIKDVDSFDPAFFNISPSEAERMDPQERLFLEVCWETLEDAGYTPENITKSLDCINSRQIGVFVGVMHRDYSLIGEDLLNNGQLVPLTLNGASIANRVSYTFDFHGPSISVDTVCSSSLTSFHLAIESIKRKESYLAIAGGVNLSLHPAKYLTYGMANMFSSDGHCHSFGSEGDGYVSGEGIGAVLLKPLKQAIKDHDNIYAIIKASSINHVGKVSGFTVPSPKAQAEVINNCLTKAKIDPRTITYVEAHGTGTHLGDPIEIEGLTKSYRKYTQDKQFCSVGSVKSNIGHTEAAAGIIGIQKVACQLYYKTIVKSLYAEKLNTNIDFINSPFFIQQKTDHWHHILTTPRRAAISAFGASGSNAHVILEEYSPNNILEDTLTDDVLIPFSAETIDSLYMYIENICLFIEKTNSNFNLDISNIINDIKTIVATELNLESRFVDVELDLSELGIDIIQKEKIKESLLTKFNKNINIDDISEQHSIREIAKKIVKKEETLRVNTNLTLNNLAYTLQVGRKTMKKRIVFLTNSLHDLYRKLNKILSRIEVIEDCWCNFDLPNQIIKDGETRAPKQKMDVNKLRIIGEKWCNGDHIDWSILYNNENLPYRISLPTYSFANKRYWLSDTSMVSLPLYKKSLHPTVHTNISDVKSLKFLSIFNSKYFFIRDHKVNGRNILPGVVYLEMARVSCLLAIGEKIGSMNSIYLSDIFWMRPIVVEKSECCVRIDISQKDDGFSFYIYEQEFNSDIKEICCQGYFSIKTINKHQKNEIIFNKERFADVRIPGNICYAFFNSIGLDYGTSFKCIECLYVGKKEVLSSLVVNEENNEISIYGLYPSLVDAALQSAIGLSWDKKQNDFSANIKDGIMPFSLASIEILKPCEKHMWAHVEQNEKSNEATQILDITIYNDKGEICSILKGFTARSILPNQTNENHINRNILSNDNNLILYPHWKIVNRTQNQYLKLNNKTLIIGEDDVLIDKLGENFSLFYKLNTTELDTDDVVAFLKNNIFIDHIVWIAPKLQTFSLLDENIKTISDIILLTFLKFTKALSSIYKDKVLEVTFITQNSQKITDKEPINITTSGLLGIIGTIAKEYLNWKIRAVDIDLHFWKRQNSFSIFELPTDRQGHLYVCRKEGIYQMELLPIRIPSSWRIKKDTVYRKGGVYIIVGGTGKIGLAISKYLISTYKAKIIWIGRSKMNTLIEEKIAKLSNLGPSPIYLTADASNYNQLHETYLEIVKQFGIVHGVIHSAMVLTENRLENMSEEEFLNSYKTKANISIAIAQVFAKIPLDFILFFSSLISFIKNAKQGHYASGCIFEDIYAAQLAQEFHCNIKIVNWGFGGRIDKTYSDSFEKLEQVGISVIDENVGMEFLEYLLHSPFRQLAFMVTSNPAMIEGVNERKNVILLNSHIIKIKYQEMLTYINRIKLQMINHKEKEEYLSCNNTIDTCLKKILFLQINKIFNLGIKSFVFEQLMKDYNVNEKFYLWIKECFEIFVTENIINVNKKNNHICQINESLLLEEKSIWNEWNILKETLKDKYGIYPQLILAETVLHSLPDVLCGKKSSTDIIFPNSSMHLVEKMYKENWISNYFNNIVAEVVVYYISQIIEQNPNAKIRILEIGAGTGGTTSNVLPRLVQYEKNIEEYCYTDISKSFLLYAKEKFENEFSFLTFKKLNIEEINFQSQDMGYYDIVIAANVLHATKNILHTISNIKALTKAGGICVLQEISHKILINHIIFGLLDGWWRFEDHNLRMHNCPGIFPNDWMYILEKTGFKNVMFPVESEHDLGQQIIVAQSDGIFICENTFSSSITEKSVERVIHQNGLTQQFKDDNLLSSTQLYIKKIISTTLKTPLDEIDNNERLEKYGIDSIFIVQMTNELKKDFSDITTNVFFENQTVNELAHFLMKNHKEDLPRILGINNKSNMLNTPKENILLATNFSTVHPDDKSKYTEIVKEPNIDQQKINQTDVAVIGMFGRYPQSNNIYEYWENLKKGVNCITEIPENRWIWNKYYGERGISGKIYTKWGGFIKNHDKFDARFFHISPKEAEGMDPQERIFLEAAYSCIEDAGYRPNTLCANNKVGVFVGVMNGYYPTGANYWSIANRVSFVFDFHGPSLAVDTACSSSLTALHIALDSIYNGTSKCAIVGGVNLIIDPFHYIKLASANMLSASDKCRAFGEGADGFVDAEGVGSILIKPLKDAIRDHDHIYGIIKGSTINSGGRTNGYSVPNPKIQTQLILDAFEKTRVNPRSISYIEAHGTGTALGDPIEVASLTNAFRHFTEDKQYCAIGSVKSNIGHCEGAAGIASIIKVLLQLKYKQIVPSLHSEKLNSNMNFIDSPFFVQHKLTHWEKPNLIIEGETKEFPRIAGVSAFGAGGTNVHTIIEEYDSKSTERKTSYKSNIIIILSAKNKKILMQKGVELLSEIDKKNFSNDDLINLAYTLQVGREEMTERLAICVNSISDLTDKLSCWINRNGEVCNDVYYNNITSQKSKSLFIDLEEELNYLVNIWIEKNRYDKIARIWVQGGSIDWNTLYDSNKPYRISLPTYPFEEERYWCDNLSRNNQEDLKNNYKNLPDDYSNIKSVIIDCFTDVSGYKKGDISENVLIRDLGLDSVMMLKLVDLIIKRCTNLNLDASNLLNCILEEEIDFGTFINNISNIAKKRKANEDRALSLDKEILDPINIVCHNMKISSKNPIKIEGEILVNEEHPFFFDHPLDHISGIHLLESTSQLIKTFISHTQTNIDLSILNLDFEFIKYCYKNIKTFINATQIVDDDWKFVFEIDILQNNQSVGKGCVKLGIHIKDKEDLLIKNKDFQLEPCDMNIVNKLSPINVLITKPEQDIEKSTWGVYLYTPALTNNIYFNKSKGDYIDIAILIEACRQSARVFTYLEIQDKKEYLEAKNSKIMAWKNIKINISRPISKYCNVFFEKIDVDFLQVNKNYIICVKGNIFVNGINHGTYSMESIAISKTFFKDLKK